MDFQAAGFVSLRGPQMLPGLGLRPLMSQESQVYQQHVQLRTERLRGRGPRVLEFETAEANEQLRAIEKKTSPSIGGNLIGNPHKQAKTSWQSIHLDPVLWPPRPSGNSYRCPSHPRAASPLAAQFCWTLHLQRAARHTKCSQARAEARVSTDGMLVLAVAAAVEMDCCELLVLSS